MSKLTAEQRIEKAHVTLMQHKTFCQFAGVFMVGKVEVSDKEPTASTNGRDVIYGRNFVQSLTDKQLAFLVVHEAMHKAYRHMSTWKNIAKENRRLANMAMDFVINLQIVQADPQGEAVQMPTDEEGNRIGCLSEEFANMDTKQVFDILKKKCKGGGGSGKGKDSGGNPTGGGQTDEESGSPNSDLDNHDWEGARKLTEEEERELSEEIDHALREGAILAGKMKGETMRGIDRLLHPKVDWKEAMRDFIKAHTKGLDQSTWRRPHKKYLANDIVMPSTYGLKAERVAIGTDTSGSIDGDILGRFLGETKLICDDVEPETIDMLYWDSHVASHEVYSGSEISNLVNSTKPEGGGGTEPDCVPEYLLKESIKPQCVIMLTDGYFFDHKPNKWEQLGVPVLWCVVGNEKFSSPVGQIVHVE